MITGVSGNKLEVKSYVANLAGHISNYVTVEVFGSDGFSRGFVRLEKEDALSLSEELNNQLSKLI